MRISRFMDLCLYHPEYGYYECGKRAIGRDGDFYTSVSVGPVFGEMLGWRFLRWMREELTPPFQIVEAGAHDGQLARDILDFIAAHGAELGDELEYLILEPSARRHQRQRQMLAQHASRVRWIEDWRKVTDAGVNGIIFSNELLDAFPVDQAVWDATKDAWFEWRVTLRDGRFGRVRGPEIAAPCSASRFGHRVGGFDDGFTMEVRDASLGWWGSAAKALRAGRLLTFDYGLEFEEYTSSERKLGTLRGYRNHRMVDAMFDHPGEQDLTAHIDLTELRAVGEVAGLTSDPTVSQGRWLTRLLADLHEGPGSFPEWTPKRLRQFQTLSHPDHLGEKFRVLSQRRLPPA